MNRCAAQHFFRQMSSGPEKRIRDKLINLDFVNFFGYYLVGQGIHSQKVPSLLKHILVSPMFG